jgi:hypothetical protein
VSVAMEKNPPLFYTMNIYGGFPKVSVASGNCVINTAENFSVEDYL